MRLYTSDSHIAHRNIIHYARRPFATVEEMDAVLIQNLRDAEATGASIVHAGDLTFDLYRVLQRYGPIFKDRTGKSIVPGNHDRVKGPARREAYSSQFETVVGDEEDWRTHGLAVIDDLDGVEVMVLVSHKPQENLWGCDVNVFGHVHNNVLFPGEGHHPEDDWAFTSPVHFCACVELHRFRPVSLQDMAHAKRAAYPSAAEEVAAYQVLYPDGAPPRTPK
jgi:calcineurin-like phosphoesterase family protein